MPELPEVETVRRGLEPHLVGATIRSLTIFDARLTQPVDPRAIEDRCHNRSIEVVRRRGKYLLIDLDDGSTIEHHLRMTGVFRITHDASLVGEDKHVRAVYELVNSANATLFCNYSDVRRFGTLRLDTSDVITESINSKLGPEPLDGEWKAADMLERCARRSAPIKAVLLDQKIVAGLGNIYVDESLFLAGVAPQLAANELSKKQWSKLIPKVRERLEIAIEQQGTTLSDFRNIDGAYGSMQEQLLVYGRAGMPCFHCGTTLQRTTIGGRTTVWCPSCQK